MTGNSVRDEGGRGGGCKPHSPFVANCFSVGVTFPTTFLRVLLPSSWCCLLACLLRHVLLVFVMPIVVVAS